MPVFDCCALAAVAAIGSPAVAIAAIVDFMRLLIVAPTCQL
jgi:hypothetical protein